MHALLLMFLCGLSIPIVIAGAGKVMLETVAQVVEQDPAFAGRALRSGIGSALFGALYEGKITIEIPIYGALGCLIYILYLVIKFEE